MPESKRGVKACGKPDDCTSMTWTKFLGKPGPTTRWRSNLSWRLSRTLQRMKRYCCTGFKSIPLSVTNGWPLPLLGASWFARSSAGMELPPRGPLRLLTMSGACRHYKIHGIYIPLFTS